MSFSCLVACSSGGWTRTLKPEVDKSWCIWNLFVLLPGWAGRSRAGRRAGRAGGWRLHNRHECLPDSRLPLFGQVTGIRATGSLFTYKSNLSHLFMKLQVELTRYELADKIVDVGGSNLETMRRLSAFLGRFHSQDFGQGDFLVVIGSGVTLK